MDGMSYVDSRVPNPVAPETRNRHRWAGSTDTKAPSQPEPWEVAATLCHLGGVRKMIKGPIGVIPHLLTIDPNFQ